MSPIQPRPPASRAPARGAPDDTARGARLSLHRPPPTSSPPQKCPSPLHCPRPCVPSPRSPQWARCPRSSGRGLPPPWPSPRPPPRPPGWPFREEKPQAPSWAPEGLAHHPPHPPAADTAALTLLISIIIIAIIVIIIITVDEAAAAWGSGLGTGWWRTAGGWPRSRTVAWDQWPCPGWLGLRGGGDFRRTAPQLRRPWGGAAWRPSARLPGRGRAGTRAGAWPPCGLRAGARWPRCGWWSRRGCRGCCADLVSRVNV